jgi:penicillin amidase
VSAARGVLRLLGRRLPATNGSLSVRGLSGPVTIRRDRHGIPHLRAASDLDAFLALGFCHGQDRSFQLEQLLRAGRGTLAELVGEDALPVDRVSRRIGFARAAARQLAGLGERERAALEAYVGGVNAARSRRRPHELVLLRRDVTPWTPGDVLAVLGLVSLGLAGNWDMEVGRLRVLERDGEEALRAVDPAYPSWLAVSAPPGRPAGSAVDRLSEDVGALASVVGGGGSNNWAVSGARTATGRPLVANDPHLSPTLPPFWYLVHLATPEWEAAGASVIGAPGLPVGHNDAVAWGVTNSGADVVDLYVEEGVAGSGNGGIEGVTGVSVVEEVVEVRGGESVVERVVVTPRGPVVLPAENGSPALSMRARYLEEVSLAGILDAPRSRTWAELHERFGDWPGAPLNLVGADVGGGFGWKVVGAVPRRQAGAGLLPQPASAPEWAGMVAPDELPGVDDPAEGFVATANNKPVADGDGPWIGADWMDGYRVQRISETLAERSDWDVEAALTLQRDVRSLVWRDVRDSVLGAPREDPRVRRAADLLHDWDGEMSAGSAPAALFSLWLAEMSVRAARAKAPGSLEWALGRGAQPLSPWTYVALRQAGHLAKLLRDRPEGWFAGGWDAEVAGALAAAMSRLEEAGTPGWGTLRPLTLRHPFGTRRPFDRAFNLGPIPYGGDTNTVSQASTAPLDPLGDPLYVATLRIAMDVGDWDRTRVSLAGGQSGNPLSPHYSDLWEHWRTGEAVAFPFTEPAVAAATLATLRLEPGSPG